MIICPHCSAESHSLFKRCQNCGSRMPTYATETPQDKSGQVSNNPQQAETTECNSREPVDVNEYFAQLKRELSQ